MELFQSRAYFPAMLLCLFTPGPLIVLLQQQYDQYFDEQISTRVAYFIRVIAFQVLLGLVVVAWVLVPQEPGTVLLMGVLLGVISNVILSSSLQMVAASDPKHIATAKLGMQSGGVLPVILFKSTGFLPTSPLPFFQHLVVTVGYISVGVSIILFLLHTRSDLFEKAYARLSYDQTKSPTEAEMLDRQTSESAAVAITESTPLNEAGASVLLSETGLLHPATDKVDNVFGCTEDGVPSWVWTWIACNGCMSGMAMCLASLAGFYGNTSEAQMLLLLKLGMDFVGRLASMTIPFLPGFKDGPWHKVMGSLAVLIVSLATVGFVKFFSYEVHIFPACFFASWCLVFGTCIFANSLVDVTTGCYVEARDRKTVARTNQFAIVGGQFFGLIIAEGVSKFLEQPHTATF